MDLIKKVRRGRDPVARPEPDEARRARANFQQKIMRELHVIVRGQSARFRLVKYAILTALFGAIYWKFGGKTFAIALAALALIGTAVHFLLRWKSKGWTEDWWLYKSLFQK